MNLRRMLARFKVPLAYAGPIAPLGNPVPWHLFNGRETEAGENVTPITAMQQACVNACVRLISESIASMSPLLYEKAGTGRTEAVNHPLYRILALEPNPDSSAFTLWSSFVGSILLTGNGYLEVTRNGSGIVTGLWFLNPLTTTVYRQADGSLVFRASEGMSDGQFRELPASNVIHVPGFSLNGITGVSVIEQARNEVGSNIAMDKFGARFFANYATPAIALMSKKIIKPEDKHKMREDWESLQSGTNQHRVAVLDQEMEIKPLSISNTDAEWLAAKNFGRQSICGLFRVHPSQIGDTARVAGETYAAQQLTFLNDCLSPWLQKIRQECTRKLLTGLPNYSIQHDIAERLKLDFETQMKGFAVGRQWGFYTANEVRRELGQNPYPSPEADMLLVPVNMMDASRLSLPPAKPTVVTEDE